MNLLQELYILLEGKAEFIADKQSANLVSRYKNDTGQDAEPLDIVKKLEKIHRKYLQWIVNQYLAAQFKMEDASRLQNDLKEFDRVKSKLEEKDINRYKSLGDLYRALQPFQEKEVISNKEADRNKKQQFFKNKEAVLFYKDKFITVVIPKTEEASCYFGRGTKWCTTARNDNMFNYYHQKGPLYIIMTHKGEKFQFHFQTDQFMDELDQDVDLEELVERYPSLKKAFHNLGRKYHRTALMDNPSPHHIDLNEIRKNPELINDIKNPSFEQLLAAVQGDGHAIRFIDNPSEEIQLVAVREIGYAIHHINNPSEEVQLAAVREIAYAIELIDNPSEAVQLAAVQQNGEVIADIDNPSEEVQLAAVQQRGDAIELIDNPSEEVQLAAVQQSGEAIQYIDNPSERVQRLAAKIRNKR